MFSEKKKLPSPALPSLPLSHSLHVVSLFKSFPKFACPEESCFSEKPSRTLPDLWLVPGAPAVAPSPLREGPRKARPQGSLILEKAALLR